MTAEEKQLAALMKAAPLPPSRVTVTEAVRLGRKDASRRRAAITGAGAAALAAIVATASLVTPGGRGPGLPHTPAKVLSSVEPGPIAWSWAPLQIPAEAGRVTHMSIDPTGRYLAATAGTSIIVWNEGVPALLQKLKVDATEILNIKVNSVGAIAVTVKDQAGDLSAWVYRRGKYTRLPNYGTSQDTNVSGFNSRGDVVGNSSQGGLLWPASAPGTVELITHPDGQTRFGGISEDGVIAGDAGGGLKPLTWLTDGTAKRLAGSGPGTGGRALLAAGDWVAGWLGAEQSQALLARWNRRTNETELLSNVDTSPCALGSDGSILLNGPNQVAPMIVTPTGARVSLPGPETGGLYLAESMTDAATTVVGTRNGLPIIWHLS